MLEKMKEIIAEQLSVEADTVTEASSFKEDLGADSLDLFELVMALEDEYSCEDTAVRTFVAKLLNNSDSAKAEFISIYLPVVRGKTYMTAVVFRNNKA